MCEVRQNNKKKRKKKPRDKNMIPQPTRFIPEYRKMLLIFALETPISDWQFFAKHSTAWLFMVCSWWWRPLVWLTTTAGRPSRAATSWRDSNGLMSNSLCMTYLPSSIHSDSGLSWNLCSAARGLVNQLGRPESQSDCRATPPGRLTELLPCDFTFTESSQEPSESTTWSYRLMNIQKIITL